jgi:hypothetical protein
MFAEALRANATLTSLRAVTLDLWADAAAGAALLAAATGHPSLAELDVCCNVVPAAHQAAAGAALGALVAANAPALRALDVSRCDLRDEALAPLVDALPRNTRLRQLSCDRNGLSAAFLRERLAPAARAAGVRLKC